MKWLTTNFEGTSLIDKFMNFDFNGFVENHVAKIKAASSLFDFVKDTVKGRKVFVEYDANTENYSWFVQDNILTVEVEAKSNDEHNVSKRKVTVNIPADTKLFNNEPENNKNIFIFHNQKTGLLVFTMPKIKTERESAPSAEEVKPRRTVRTPKKKVHRRKFTKAESDTK